MRRHLLSVCIPTYEMGGVGHEFLRHSFEILTQQTFRDFEVVVSDFSKDAKVRDLCATFADRLDLRYTKNEDPVVGMSTNTNNAVRHATGKLVKVLFQDDFLYGREALARTVERFDLERDTWLVSACIHTKDGTNFFRPHPAKYSADILRGNNTIGSPSVLTIKNQDPLRLDPNLRWLVDCDLYYRYQKIYGPPKTIDEVTVAIRVGEHQITHTEATQALRDNEAAYVRSKHNLDAGKRRLPNVSVVSISGINPASGIPAMLESMRGLEFHEAVLIGHHPPDTLPDGITFKQCRPTDLRSKDPKDTTDYSRFVLYELHRYIESDFALLVHRNAYVVRPRQWLDDFLAYDYIGAPWPPKVHFAPNGTNVRIGNGGFSLRSQRLMRAPTKLNLPFTDCGTGYFNEDGVLCVYHRAELERHGIRFAPVELAALFSLETECPESRYDVFGFHDNTKALPFVPRLRDFLARTFAR